jgi:predicted ATPase
MRGAVGEREERLLERAEELSAFDELLTSAARGTGCVGVVQGEPGIGKSSLLSAARSEAADREFTVLSARGTELEVDFPFGVVRQLFEPPLRLVGERSRAELLSGAATLSQSVFEPPESGPSSTDPSFGALHGLFWLTSNLAERGGLLLVVDDAQWADRASLRYLAFLATRVEDLPCVLLVAMRPLDNVGLEMSSGQALETLRAHPGVRLVEPSPLSAPAVGELLADRLGGPVPVEVQDAAHRATGGNPFFTRELASELRGEAGAEGASDPARIAGLAPTRVVESVLRRLDALGEGPRSLARATAVLGDPAELEVAASLASVEPAAASDCAARLASAGIFADDRHLAFQHAVIRSAVYDSMPPSERALAHKAAAALLADRGMPDEKVAAQLLHSPPGGDPDVARALRRAARVAQDRAAPEAALDLLDRRCVGTGSPRGCLRGRGRPVDASGDRRRLGRDAQHRRARRRGGAASPRVAGRGA